MATVFDVAKYILDNVGSMSAMKLQKLVFYSQAMSLVWDDIPLFADEFEAWAKGPVCKALYNAHKGMFMLSDSSFLDDYDVDLSRLSDINKETIDVVINSLKDLPAYELSEMTHREAPWLQARGSCPDGGICTNIISKESMLDYYQQNW